MQRKSGCPTLANTLRLLRRTTVVQQVGYWKRCYTQSDVAEAAGIGRSKLAQYETGARAVTRDDLDRLAAVFGVRFTGIKNKHSAHHMTDCVRQVVGDGEDLWTLERERLAGLVTADFQ